MPLSSFVVPGAVATADHYNSLRHDVLDSANGHTHDGVNGARVNHGNLVHPGGYTPTNEHQQIDNHIASRWGVHGLKTNPAEHVMGVLGGGLTAYPITYTFTTHGNAHQDGKVVTFPNDVRFNTAVFSPIVLTGFRSQNLGYVRIYEVHADRVVFSVWMNEPSAGVQVTVYLLIIGVLQ